MQVERCLTRGLGGAAALGAAMIGGVGPAGAATSSPTHAVPKVAILSPRRHASFQQGSHVVARFRCTEGGLTKPIVACKGTVPWGHAINTTSIGTRSFTVTATDTSGRSVRKTVRYTVWAYVNPLRDLAELQAQRIDMGVDYAGSGPILAIGRAKVISAGYYPGPESCYGRTCAPPPGGWVAYQLLQGPFKGKYVYQVENITPTVKTGQIVKHGQQVALLHLGSPNLEIGWAAGREVETLAIADGHQCPCDDPGGWSTIEGRNFDSLLVWLGAPSGYLQETPHQSMPHGWPGLPRRT